MSKPSSPKADALRAMREATHKHRRPVSVANMKGLKPKIETRQKGKKL